MIIKVCGIKYQDNLGQMADLPIDMIGLNFYPRSKRYIESPLSIPSTRAPKKLVGVFVNNNIESILNKVYEYQLDYVQLHGHESPDMVNSLAREVKVIKAFAISNKVDFEQTEGYETVSYFLFDTKTPEYGGSGNKWKWDLLDHYTHDKPFLLAGGIGPHDWEDIKKVKHPLFAGVDINSRFEVEPGRKDVNAVDSFARKCKKENYINQKSNL